MNSRKTVGCDANETAPLAATGKQAGRATAQLEILSREECFMGQGKISMAAERRLLRCGRSMAGQGAAEVT